MAKRYCSFPKDPFGFRDWYESQFGDLCKTHDEAYALGYKTGGCKLCADFKFAYGIASRGHGTLAILSLIAVQAPWLWWKWGKNTCKAIIKRKESDMKQEKKPEMVSSTSDERTRNNVMRHEYKVLSDEEKAAMQAIKDDGLALHDFIDSLGESRELSIAKTKLEEAVMWTVKHITG